MVEIKQIRMVTTRNDKHVTRPELGADP